MRSENFVSEESVVSIVKGSPRRQQEPARKENLISQSIERGEETRFKFEKVLLLDYCLLTFSIASILLSIIYYEADYVDKSKIVEVCLRVTDVNVVLAVCVTVVRYKVQIQLEKSQRILEQEETLHSSGKMLYILLEIMVLLFQPYSFLNNIKITTENIYDGFEFEYKINYILVVLGFAKIFIVMRVVLENQIYMSPRSSRLCRMYGSESNFLYAIKCLFKDSPLSLIGVVFAVSIAIFSVALRIAERNLVIEYPKHFNGAAYPANIENLENSVWLTIITMTTVGFGDFFPRTIFGRAIDVVLVIWGTFIVSLMVVVLTNTLNMDQAEKRALIVLNRLEAKKELKEAAAYLITHSCRKFLINKKITQKLRPTLSQRDRMSLENTFYKYLSNFQNVHRSIRSMYEIDDVYEEMTRQFEVINDEVNSLLASQKQTILTLSPIANYKPEERPLREVSTNVAPSNKNK